MSRVKSFKNTLLEPKFSVLQPGEVLMSLPSFVFEIYATLYRFRWHKAASHVAVRSLFINELKKLPEYCRTVIREGGVHVTN